MNHNANDSGRLPYRASPDASSSFWYVLEEDPSSGEPRRLARSHSEAWAVRIAATLNRDAGALPAEPLEVEDLRAEVARLRRTLRILGSALSTAGGRRHSNPADCQGAPELPEQGFRNFW